MIPVVPSFEGKYVYVGEVLGPHKVTQVPQRITFFSGELATKAYS